jgi:hypothetical protein
LLNHHGQVLLALAIILSDHQLLLLHVQVPLALAIILSVNPQELDLQTQPVCLDQWVDHPDQAVLEDLDLVDQVDQDQVDQVVVQEILVDLDLADQVDQVVDLGVPEVLVDQDQVDQVVDQEVPEVLVDQDQVDQVVDLEVPEVLVVIVPVDQVVFQPCLEFNHQDVPDNEVVQVVAETQLVHLVAKEGLTKNVQNQNAKNVKSLKISWKHHNLVVCNYLKVMAEQFA